MHAYYISTVPNQHDVHYVNELEHKEEQSSTFKAQCVSMLKSKFLLNAQACSPQSVKCHEKKHMGDKNIFSLFTASVCVSYNSKTCTNKNPAPVKQ